MNKKVNIFWFRRDLRLDDNLGFYEALRDKHPVLPMFIFDTEILEQLPKDDARVTFIHQTLQSLRQTLQDDYNSSIAIFHGKPEAIFKQLMEDYEIEAVYTNHDYEPYATQRDQEIQSLLETNSIAFHTYKDQVIFEKSEVVKKDDKPYLVYTPYMRTWKEKFQSTNLEIYYTNSYLDNVIEHSRLPNLSLSDIGFEKSNQEIKAYEVTPTLIQEYEATRNFPAKDATSHLGPHLRFGTVSIRKMVKKAIAAGMKYGEDRGVVEFEATDSAADKIEYIYRLLVHDTIINPLPQDQVNQVTMKHRLAIWASKIK